MMSDLTPGERSLADVEKQLGNFTSPVKAFGAAASNNGMNANDFYEQTIANSTAPLGSSGSPRRTPLLQRSATPIMSNSSSKKDLRMGYYGGRVDEDDDVLMDTAPAPVDTPMPQQQNNEQSPSGLSSHRTISPSGVLFPATSSLSQSSWLSRDSFSKYHDALAKLLSAKRSLDTRMELEVREKQATGDSSTMKIAKSLENLSPEDYQSKVEVEFCDELSEICYRNSSYSSRYSSNRSSLNNHSESMNEGHVWRLLAELRLLGLDAILWADDSTSATQNESSVKNSTSSITSKVKKTPKEIIQLLLSDRCIALQRMQRLVLWTRSCMEHESKTIKAMLPSRSAGAIESLSHPDDPSTLSQTAAKKLELLMKTCLCLVLEGKVEKASDVANTHGFGIGAALWIGGEPYGNKKTADHDNQTVNLSITGNPERFLWKRMVWNAGRQLLKEAKQQHQGYSALKPGLAEEAAIYSILSNDVNASLENPVIQESWTRSLGVLLTGVWERVVDETLKEHSDKRRKCSAPPYPGTQYKVQEEEHSAETKELQGMRGHQIAATLAINPFLLHERNKEECQGEKVSYKAAMLAFIVGKSEIARFCKNDPEKLLFRKTKVRDDQDLVGLRFLAHLLLFIDSFDVSTKQVYTNDLTGYKNQILYEYVKYLESRPDLRLMTCLYVSLLPQDKILEYYPQILAKVLKSEDRDEMMNQIHDFMPSLELSLLRKVVRIILNSTLFEGDDQIKCESFEWLLKYENYCGDALICANIFLRQLLLHDDKIELAMYFIADVLPRDICEQVESIVYYIDEKNDTEKFKKQVQDSLTEYNSYVKFLDAYRAFETFKETLHSSREEESKVSELDTNNLTDTEKSIAASNAKQSWIRQQRSSFEMCLEAAENALKTLNDVLTYGGGWLSFKDAAPKEKEEIQRQNDMQMIRARYLVLTISLYHQVCDETAVWISRRFDEGEKVGFSRKEVFQCLDREASTDSDASNSMYSPRFWYKHAMNLINIVASDKYSIHEVFGTGDLQELLSKIAETAVAEMLNQ